MNILTTKKTYLLAGCAGLFVSVIIGYFIIEAKRTATHPVGTSHDNIVHVHGDFRMYIGDERIRFTDEKYQSSTARTHHASLHFHDGNDEVIHRHANNVTFVEFFDSIGMTVTNDCLTLDTGITYCSTETETLQLLVNGQRITDLSQYVFAEEDRILLYYGTSHNPKLADYIAGITDLSCLYSGTCPERGTPPTESCGLTCEVADQTPFQSQSWWLTIKNLF